jgi:hypothetical protein
MENNLCCGQTMNGWSIPTRRDRVLGRADCPATEFTSVARRTLHDMIRESLRIHGVTTFPYIFLAKPNELQEDDDEGE